MPNPTKSIDRLVSEQEEMARNQSQLFENLNIIVENLKLKSDQQDLIVKNQHLIIRNQETIVDNQINIIGNQRKIVGNQNTLQLIKKMLGYVIEQQFKKEGNQDAWVQANELIQKLELEVLESADYNMTVPKKLG